METAQRVTLAIGCWVLSLIITAFLGSFILGIWEKEGWGMFFGILAGIIIVGKEIPYFMVSVPEVTGLLTVNILRDGELRPYGPGIHFRFPWEQVKDGNYINLRVITRKQTETYPSGDGPAMRVEWSYQYRPVVELLPRYIAVDEETIDNGIQDIGSGVLSQAIGNMEAMAVKKDQEALGERLRKSFEGATISSGDQEQTLEKFYGIELLKVALADADYDERFQKIRTTEKIADRVKQIAKKIQGGEKGISDKDALNSAMILNGDVKKNIQEVEGEGGKALAALLMGMANAKGGQ